MKKRQSGYMVAFGSAWNRVRRGSQALTFPKRKSKLGKKASLRTSASFKETDTGSLKRKQKRDADEEELSLYDKMDQKLFKKDLNGKKYSDIVRVAHSVSIESKNSETGESELFIPKEEVPDSSIKGRQAREMRRMAFAVEKLLTFFGSENDEEEMIEFVHEFCDKFDRGEIEKRHFNLTRMFRDLQLECNRAEQMMILQKVRSVLKFLHISVVIFSIEEMRNKLDLGLQHLTKDMKDGGWKIKIRLNERYVEVSHSRRECCLQQKSKEDYWEIAYNVTASFDSEMKNLSAVRLSVNDLQMSPKIDAELGAELKEKFFNGNFIIC